MKTLYQRVVQRIAGFKPPSQAIWPTQRAIYPTFKIYCPAVPFDPPMQSGIFTCMPCAVALIEKTTVMKSMCCSN